METQVSDDNVYLTASEVAAAYPVSKQQLWRWARLEQVPNVRLPSGRLLFLESDIEKMLAKGGWSRGEPS